MYLLKSENNYMNVHDPSYKSTLQEPTQQAPELGNNVGLMLVQRCRWWMANKTTLVECPVFPGYLKKTDM